MMKHNNNNGKIVSSQLFLGIFLDNVKVPHSQTKRLLGESRNTRYNMRYKADGPAVGVLGTYIPSSRAGNVHGLKVISCFVMVSCSRKVTGN